MNQNKHFARTFLSAAVLLHLSLTVSCSAGLLTGPIRVHKSSRTVTDPDGRAEISRVEFRSSNMTSPQAHNVVGLKRAIRFALLNSGKFSRVSFGAPTTGTTDGTVTQFEFLVRAEETSEINWAWAWPAVYPMPGYWPVQPKSGTVKVTVEVRAFRSGRLVMEKTFVSEKEYSVTIYGFYRTSPIERRILACYEDALEDLARAVAAADFGLAARPGPDS